MLFGRKVILQFLQGSNLTKSALETFTGRWTEQDAPDFEGQARRRELAPQSNQPNGKKPACCKPPTTSSAYGDVQSKI